MYTVNNQKSNRVIRIDEFGILDLMDTVNPCADPPLAFLEYQDTLYHAGYKGIYTYIDSVWVPLIDQKAFFTMTIYKDELLIGGLFYNAVSSHDGVAITYNGNNFSPFQNIYDLLDDPMFPGGASISNFQEYKGKLYIAGNFEGDGYNEILSWDGVNWDDMDGGITGNSGMENISDLIVYKDELYVGGIFSMANGSKTNNIYEMGWLQMVDYRQWNIWSRDS